MSRIICGLGEDVKFEGVVCAEEQRRGGSDYTSSVAFTVRPSREAT
jgi:hypothetical protein